MGYFNSFQINLSPDKKYSLVVDPIDWRDYYYDYQRATLREQVDLRSVAGDIQSQRDLGSCTAQAIVAVYEIMLMQQVPAAFQELSPLFLYYNSRLEEGTLNEDAGAYLRNSMKALQTYGICPESDWPYDTKKFDVRPDDNAYRNAKKFKISQYKRLPNLSSILDSINADHPVVAGIMVYSGFDRITKENPILSVPLDTDTEYGAHAIALIGYNLTEKKILAKNSFGKSWGLDGYFWIPFDYIEQELTDAWIFDILLN